MNTLKIPKAQQGISKTLRFPKNIVTDIKDLADLKNTSLNQITIQLITFALENLDVTEKEALKNFKKSKTLY